MSDKKPVLRFPKRFLWGAGISAHQVEGATHNQWSVWELENAKSLAARAEYQFGDLENWRTIKDDAKDPNSYVSGRSTDHYKMYLQDFDLLKNMNMNSLRFSIEWSRIEPEEGAWNAEAIDHYKQYVSSLKKSGVEPIVTLFHFALPVWFAQKGGFEKRSNVAYFTRFTEKVVSELGLEIRFIITLNEPEVYAYESYMVGAWPPNNMSRWKFWRVMNNLAYAHKQAAKVIHGMSRRYKVSIAKNSHYFYAGDDAWLSRFSAMIMQYVQDDYFIRKVVKSCDFLGVNFYGSDRVYGYRIHNAEKKVSDTGSDLSPADIQHALERLYDKYHMSIIITKSGVADSDDTRRQWWISQTLVGIQRALNSGVKVEGYLYWSLLDSFEWTYGTWPRFGLAHVDYATKKRTLRPSAIWYGKVIKHLRSIK